MKAKRILFTVTNDLTYDQRMIRICGSLAKAGYSVCLIGRERKNSLPLRERAFEQRRLSCIWNQGKLFYLEYNLRLFFLLLFSRFDGICAIDLDTILPAFLIGKVRRKKIIYDAHEYFTETPEVVRRPGIKKVWEFVAQCCIPRIPFAYTVGDELRQILSVRYGCNFSLIRNVPFARQATSIENKIKPPVLLYQGVLNEGRGISEALQAMQYIDGAELWLIGEGDLSQQLRAECQSLGLENKVHFKGYLPPEQLADLTAQASIGLNLLENKSLNYYYSLANKTFDYIQAGVPAIHMDFPEYRALNQHWEVGLLIATLDPKEIAEAINELLENEQKYVSLVEKCAEAAQELVWEKEEQKLLNFYVEVFKNRKGA